MIAECESYFPIAALISLDHDLNPAPGATADPGTGLDVARCFGDFQPVCPVLIHPSRFERDPERGYGQMTRIQLREIMAGANGRDTASKAFGGQGSMGNDAAMPVTPPGAYFADELERCVEEARSSALVTHTYDQINPAKGFRTAPSVDKQMCVPLDQFYGRRRGLLSPAYATCPVGDAKNKPLLRLKHHPAILVSAASSGSSQDGFHQK